jgi:hypothetical protein
MHDQQGPNDGQGKAEGDRTPSNVSMLNRRQKAYQRAQRAYEATQRLGKRLSDTAGRLTTSEWITAIFTAVIAAATIWNVVVVKGSLHVLQGQLNEMQAEHRPWLYVDDQIAAIMLHQSVISIAVKDMGTLPAVEVTTGGTVGALEEYGYYRQDVDFTAIPCSTAQQNDVPPQKYLGASISKVTLNAPIGAPLKAAVLHGRIPYFEACLQYRMPYSDHLFRTYFLLPISIKKRDGDQISPGGPANILTGVDPTGLSLDVIGGAIFLRAQ